MDRKTVLITGASRGIGRETALTFAKAGYNVIVNYRSNEESANELVSLIKENNVESIAIKADVSKYEECKELIEKAIEKFGQIDVLVNNAGITKDGLILRMKEEAFDDVISTNLKSVFNMINIVSPYMVKKRYGRIINISSVIGIYGNKGQANYAAAKAGIIGLTKSVAKELGARNITCNAVAPGFIETDMTKVLGEKVLQNIADNTIVKRAGTPEDIANAVLFLASEKSGYITGQVLAVDGGLIL